MSSITSGTDQISLSSLIVGLIGTIASVLSILYAIKTEKKSITFSWEYLRISTKELYMTMRKKFMPDLIFVPDIKVGIIAHMIESRLSEKISARIPIFVGTLIWKTDDYPLHLKLNDKYIKRETDKWHVHVPKELLSHRTKKILIVSDCALSGEMFFELKKLFKETGFAEDNIKTVSIITTQIARNTYKVPDYYWKITESSEYYFPWGKGR